MAGFGSEFVAYVQIFAIGISAALLVFGAYLVNNYYGIWILLGILLTLYVAMPFVLHFSPWLQRHLIYMHRFQWSFGDDFFEPLRYGLIGRNLYLEGQSAADLEPFKIGVWHILPKSLHDNYLNFSDSSADSTDWDDSFNHGAPIVIYFHGNMGSRATGHRIELYRILHELNYHVVSFDYNGFSDSTKCSPSKFSTLQDGLLVYNWVKKHLNSSKAKADDPVPIFFWGHSLGSGVSTQVLSALHAQESDEGDMAAAISAGLILEAPFTSLKDVFLSHPISWPYCWWPKHDWLFTGQFEKHGFDYETDKYLNNVDIPIQIFHATNDPVIPAHICTKLTNSLKSNDKDVSVHFFDELSSFSSHAFLCRCEKLPSAIHSFVSEKCLQKKKEQDKEKEK